MYFCESSVEGGILGTILGNNTAITENNLIVEKNQLFKTVFLKSGASILICWIWDLLIEFWAVVSGVLVIEKSK